MDFVAAVTERCKVKGEFLCRLSLSTDDGKDAEPSLTKRMDGCRGRDEEEDCGGKEPVSVLVDVLAVVVGGSLTILGTFIDSLLVRSLASASSMKSDSLRWELIGGV